jgi:hypothetical protein
VFRRLRLLREYFEFKFFTPSNDTSLDFFMKNRPEKNDDLGPMKEWGKDFFSEFTQNAFYKILDDLKKQVKLSHQVVVYVPYDPSQSNLDRLGKWFRQNVNDDVVLDVRFDGNVIGGCSVVWNNTYHDFSIYYLLEENREKVMELINSYSNDRPQN